MKLNAYNILGIPIENLSIRESAEKIIALVYQQGPPVYISTVNADFIANVYSWSYLRPACPVLLKTLRESAFTTADGFPIVLLSLLLGNSLKGRVTGADLVPELLELLSIKNRSVYFLGGDLSSTQMTIKKFKDLKVAGIDCSEIFLDHPKDEIIEKINQAKPDVLLISLGNPKQELWFDQVKEKLKVPVSIGIGGTLNFISGKILRAPLPVQCAGLEWLWRLIQEPRRLFRRYLHDFLKMIWLSIPLIFYHHVNQWITLLLVGQAKGTFLSPGILNKATLKAFDQALKEALKRGQTTIDLSQTRHMDIIAIGYLIKILLHEQVSFTGIRWNLKLLLIFHRVWDLFLTVK